MLIDRKSLALFLLLPNRHTMATRARVQKREAWLAGFTAGLWWFVIVAGLINVITIIGG